MLVLVVVVGLGLLADPAALRVGAAAVLIAFGCFRLSSRAWPAVGALPRAPARAGMVVWAGSFVVAGLLTLVT